MLSFTFPGVDWKGKWKGEFKVVRGYLGLRLELCHWLLLYARFSQMVWWWFLHGPHWGWLCRLVVQWNKFIAVFPQTLLCMCSVLSWLLQVLAEECWQRWLVVLCQVRTLVYTRESKICAALRMAIIGLMTTTRGVAWGECWQWWCLFVSFPCPGVMISVSGKQVSVNPVVPRFWCLSCVIKIVPACRFGFFCACWNWRVLAVTFDFMLKCNRG